MMLSIVLEGIYRGIGMDRVIFGLLTRNRQHLRGKYGLGVLKAGGSRISGSTWVQLRKMFSDTFLSSKKPLWVTERPEASIKPLLTEELSEVVGEGPFLSCPCPSRM